MFFVLSKLLFFLLNPLFWLGIILLLLVLVRSNKLRKKLSLLALVIFLIFTNNAIQKTISKHWEVKTAPIDEIEGIYNYAIVLGGMSNIDLKENRLMIDRSIDRLLGAVILYHNGKVKKILITGGSGELLNQKKKESIFLKDLCIKLGVKEEDIIIETESRNTYENAYFSKKYIKEGKVLLITSAFHMRRSAAIFKKAGYHFDILSTDYISNPISVDDYFLPKARALENWTLVTKEIIGYFVYWLVGYL